MWAGTSLLFIWFRETFLIHSFAAKMQGTMRLLPRHGPHRTTTSTHDSDLGPQRGKLYQEFHKVGSSLTIQFCARIEGIAAFLYAFGVLGSGDLPGLSVRLATTRPHTLHCFLPRSRYQPLQIIWSSWTEQYWEMVSTGRYCRAEQWPDGSFRGNFWVNSRQRKSKGIE